MKGTFQAALIALLVSIKVSQGQLRPKCHPDFNNKYCQYFKNQRNHQLGAWHSIVVNDTFSGTPNMSEVWIGFDASEDLRENLYLDDEKIVSQICSNLYNDSLFSDAYEWVASDLTSKQLIEWQKERISEFKSPERAICPPGFNPRKLKKNQELVSALDKKLEIEIEERFGFVITENCNGTSICPSSAPAGSDFYNLHDYLDKRRSLCAYHNFRKCVQQLKPTPAPTSRPTPDCLGDDDLGLPEVLAGQSYNYTTNTTRPVVSFQIEIPGPCADGSKMELKACGSEFDTYFWLYNCNNGYLAHCDDSCNPSGDVCSSSWVHTFWEFPLNGIAPGMYILNAGGWISSVGSGKFNVSFDCIPI